MNIYQAKMRRGQVSSQLDIFLFGGIVSSPRKTAYCGFTTVRTVPDTPSEGAGRVSGPRQIKNPKPTHLPACNA